MVEVEVDPHRVVLLEHGAQLVVDALRQEDRHPRADADDLDVRDLSQAAQDRLEELGRQGQSVATGDEHVAHLGRSAQVLELRLMLLAVEVLRRVTDDARARAVAAIRGALRGHQHQDPVRIAVDESGHGRVAVLGERVLHHRREGLLFAAGRDDLAADRVGRVLRVDEADEVGRDVDAELVRRGEPFALVVGQLEDGLDLLEVVDPVRELPAPVVPLLVGHVGPFRGPTAARRETVRSQRSGRIAPIDERCRLGRLRRHGGLDLLLVHARSPVISVRLVHRNYAEWMAHHSAGRPRSPPASLLDFRR